MLGKRTNYDTKRRLPRWAKRLGLIVLAIIIALIVAGFFARQAYYNDLKPADVNGKARSVQIVAGASGDDIAAQLAKDGIIKSKWSFEIYLTRTGARDDLKAGSYSLSPAMNVEQIVSILSHGRVATHLVTIIPGSRLDQVRQALIDAGFSASSVDQALNPSNYPNNPALVDKPAGASLEGFLYPDSFAKDTTTQPEQIISESLAEMAQQLTPSLRAAYASEGLNVYQGITLASMVEQEASAPSDRAQVAQVFLSRLRSGGTLGSDVTAFYGALVAGKSNLTPGEQLQLNTPYNTLINPGLPPGPISNVDDTALNAVAHPASTDWMYFVAGDNGKVYFSQTLAQHEAQVAAHCHKLCNVQ